MSSEQNPDRNPAQSPDQNSDQNLESASGSLGLPPATGFRALLLKLLRGTIALLEKAIIQLEQPGAAEFDRRYGQALEKIRGILPAQVNAKLPDWGLSGAIAALTILFFWTTTSVLFPARSTPAPQTPPQPIAVLPETPSAPEVAPVPDLTTEAPPDLPPELPPPVTSLPTPEASPNPPELAPEPSSETADAEQIAENPLEIPGEIPAPVPELTPEQVLIATIQDQIIEITTGEPAGLIVKILPNFNESLLKVQVSQDWYNLSPEQQDQIAAGVAARSQTLDFRQLLLIDPNHRLVARKAVVGNGMIILRRVLV
ncbi:MAG: hypothetical protein HC916_04005 [Coleofasciculaceae cyanobacterium SM2_1_6]|nr:hypothetical protein [Coleofasciculaceae cyanobacterium SM2_1_6]